MSKQPQFHLLIVDDEPNVLYTLEMLLSPENYEISLASTGAQAIKLVEASPPDAILLDVMMPEMTGFEVCQRLKGDPRWQHIPIILVTAMDRDFSLSHGIQAGADDFLSKPVNGTELRARVRSMLRIKHTYDELQFALQLHQDMADIILHDLKNPLTSIMLSSNTWLRSKNKSISSEKFLKRINVQAQRILHLTDNLLVMTKLKNDHLELNHSTMNIVDLVLEVVEDSQEAGETREIQLIVDASEKSLVAEVDRRLLALVLHNLIANALNNSSRGGTIWLRISPIDTAVGGWEMDGVCIQIIDEGIGIPDAEKAVLFNRQNVINAYRTRQPHYGLSFPLCAKIIEEHNGEIKIDDNNPTGSIITLLLRTSQPDLLHESDSFLFETADNRVRI